ncbi:MAG: N-formylglutamate amidohydrolase, partial [Pseudomonadota bacterium]
FVADHAGNQFPKHYNDLGLSSDLLETHIAIDIGTHQCCEYMSNLLNAPAIIAQYSRLLIDLNRPPNDPTSIREISDGHIIPGNINIASSSYPREQKIRIQRYFMPYHDMIDAQLNQMVTQQNQPALIAIHSFTPSMQNKKRPWHIGVLSNHDRRLADPFLKALHAEKNHFLPEQIGDNLPYSGHDPHSSYTIQKHAVNRQILHLAIEIRQDLLTYPKDINKMAEILCRTLQKALNCAS